MNAKYFAVVALLGIPLFAQAQQSEPSDNERVELKRIDDQLRPHIPALQGTDAGMLVSKCSRDSAAFRKGVRVADIILFADGRPIANNADLGENTKSIIVIRRGRTIALSGQRGRTMQPNPAFFGVPPIFPPFPSENSGVSASSFASGNENVSVSRSGDQFSVEMSLPALTKKPIRLRGTLAQIQTKLAESGLPSAAKQRVLKVIQQNR